jgi:hypothetical protein
MREILTTGYIKMTKESYGWDLPGDSGYPPGVSERDIVNEFDGRDENVSRGKDGESEINVNWKEFEDWYMTGGSPLPAPFEGRQSPSYVNIQYNYDIDYDVDVENSSVHNIKPVGGVDLLTRSPISDPVVLESIVEYFDEEIRRDILTSEREMGSGRESYEY